MSQDTSRRTPPGGRPARDARDPRDPRGLKWQLAERRRFRGAVLLLLMTLVAPGSAELVAGNKRLGRIALGAYVVLLGAVVLVAAFVSAETLAGLFARSWLLTLTWLALLALAAAWIGLLVNAWRLGRPPTLTRRHRVTVLVMTIVGCLLVSVPLGSAARYAQIARDDILGLFPEGDAAAAADGRLNVLLIGGDAAEDRPGVRADSLNLASIDVTTGKAVLFSLPRNLQEARFAEGTALRREFPQGFTNGVPDDSAYLLNAVYNYGAEHPELTPGAVDHGAEATKQAVSGVLGLPVHYYVMVNIEGFRDLVDALGGVTVKVRSEVPYTVAGEVKVIEPGTQRLTGRQVLMFTRSRQASDDYSRMGRQRCVLGAILREATPQNVLANFQDLATTAKGLMSTDIAQGTLPQLIGLAGKAKDQRIRSVALTPPLVQTADPDYPLIHAKVRSAIAQSEKQATGGSGAAGGSGSGGSSSSSGSGTSTGSGGASATPRPTTEAIDAGC